jgi:2-aminoadipate transaminase
MHFNYASRVNGMSSSAIREILKITQQPDIISFAGGMPAPQTFPVDMLKRSFEAVLTERGAAALQYGVTEGFAPLRTWIAERMNKKGIRCQAENVLISSGSQQILDFAGKIFFDPGDKVIVESPVYLAAVQTFRTYQVEFITVPADKQGMDTSTLEQKVVEHKPKLIYVNPTFENPTGATMPAERRAKIAEIAARYQVPVIEDDPYGELRFEGEVVSPIKSYPGGEWVIHMSSFSKIISPGLRVGWAVADTDIIRKLTMAKQSSDVHTNSLTQQAIYHYVTTNSLNSHIEHIVEVYRVQRDTMLEEMDRHFPASCKWSKPEGGMFIWVELPEGSDATQILPKAVAEKVAFVPGGPFYADKGKTNTMRLNFSNSSPEQIRTGIRCLGSILKAELG